MEDEGAFGATGSPATAAPTVVPSLVDRIGHRGFSGTYPAKLEPSGRLILASSFRGAFTGTGRLRPMRERNLMLWTETAFELAANAYAAAQKINAAPRARKAFYASAPQVTIDKQGRLIVPGELRGRVGIDEHVVLVGAIDAVEIWPLPTYEAEMASSLTDADAWLETYDGPSLDGPGGA